MTCPAARSTAWAGLRGPSGISQLAQERSAHGLHLGELLRREVLPVPAHAARVVLHVVPHLLLRVVAAIGRVLDPREERVHRRMGLEPEEQIERQSVAVLLHGRMDRTVAARHDFCYFLWDLESRYWGGMYRYLKTELGVRPPVSGTQMGYGPAHPQAELDYIDAHAKGKK